jgi:hypothetical protein
MPKVDQKAWTSFGKKEREKVVRGRKKKKNNKAAPYAKSRPKSMNIHDLHLEHNSYKHNL